MEDFSIIYRQSVQKVYHFLLGLTRNPELAEELTEETFYQAYLHLDSFREKCAVDTWLCAIAKNLYFKERKRHSRFHFGELTETMMHRTGEEDALARWEERQQVELIQRLLEDGTEAFVNQMEPEKAYEALCTPVVSFLDRSDDISYGGDGRQIPSKLEVAFPEGNSEQKYMVEDISLIQDLIDDGDGSIGGKIYREEGLDAYVHWIMVTGETETLADSACDYILTEEDYLRLEKKYGPIEDPWISTLEVNGKTYYCRTAMGREGTGEYAEHYLEEFTDDMRRVVPEIEDLDPLYVYIARSSIVPEELWQIKEETLEKIRGWYEKYAAYYKDMGYETFREGWRNYVAAELNRILGENGEITDVQLGKSRGYDVWKSGDPYDPENTSWNMIWDVACSEGSFYVYLNVEEDGSDPWLYAFRDDRVEFTSFDPLMQ